MQNVTAQQENIHTTDILVVGGGVVGLALCQGLLHDKLGLHVTLVSSGSIHQSNVYADDVRAIALAHSTECHLAAMGIPLPECHAQIQQIHISDRGHLGQTRLRAQEQGVSALGYVTQLSALETVITQQLSKQSADDIALFENTQCRVVELSDEGVTARLATGQVIHAKTIVFADGQGTDLKTSLGIVPNMIDYQQHALVSIVGVSRSGPARYQTELTAFERFTENGPLALLPMHRDALHDTHCTQYYSLVWCGTEQDITALCALDDDRFMSELQQAFGDRAGLFSYVSTRQHFPLKLTCHSGRAQRVFTLGNAAQALHPIAGQGFNLGIRDVISFIASIKELSSIEMLGAHSHQDRFAALRETDRQIVINMTSLLVTVFSNAIPGLVLGRNKALNLLHAIPPIKKWFAKKAMGYQ